MVLEHVILGRALTIWVVWEAPRSASGAILFQECSCEFPGGSYTVRRHRGGAPPFSFFDRLQHILSLATNYAPQLVLCLGKDGLHPLL